jgi:hypothetical protein
MLLNSTTDLVQLVTTAAGDIDVHAHWADLASGTVTVDRKNTTITTAATTTIVPSPGASTARKVKNLNITNAHASVTNTVTIQVVDATSGVTSVIDSIPLLAGERTAWREGVPMRVVDANGVEKTRSLLAEGTATTAQIAAHSADTYYLGMNVSGRLQAGSWFRWAFRANKAAAGTATPTYIIRYGTAGTTSDTARVTVTGAAQTGVADEAYIIVEAAFRAIGASAVLVGQVQLWHRLATTGFSVTAANVFATPVVSGTFDSTVANSIIGLSVNPGTSAAWVTDLVTLETGNLIP